MRGRAYSSGRWQLRNPWRVIVGLCAAAFFVMYVTGFTRRQGDSAPVGPSPRLRKAGLVSRGKVQLSDLIAAAIHLSEVAAHEIIEVKQGGTESAKVKGKTDEGVDEPVTVADAKSNSIFVNGLRQLFPGIDILSEETDPEPQYFDISYLKDVKLQKDPWLDLGEVLVTVDPLDATKEFTENLLEYVTTMVCVVHKGRPIAGVINEVFLKDEAAIWGVAMDDGYQELHGVPGLDGPTEEGRNSVMISRSHTGAGADVVTQKLPGHHPVYAGGSGFKSLKLVKGQAEAYIHVTKIKAWDVCAADAVVRAAGGKFTDLHGGELTYTKDAPLFSKGLVAATDPAKHQWVVEHLKDV